jgi:hypothetical protein
VVVVGEDPALQSLGASFAGTAEVQVLQVPLDAGWRGGLRSACALAGGRPTLLLPAWHLAEAGLAEALRIPARTPIAEAVLEAWLDAGAGTAAVTALVPRNLLESQRALGIRQLLWDRDLCRNVTEFDCGDLGVPHVHPRTGLSLLELGPRREREAEHAVGFVDGRAVLVSELGRARIEKELVRLRGPFGTRSEFGFRGCWAAAEDALTRQRHDPELGDAARSLEETGATVPLNELVDEWRTGVPLDGGAFEPDPGGEARVIRETDLDATLRSRTLADLPGHRPAGALPGFARLRGGDLLVGRVLRPTAQGPAVEVVPDLLEGAIADASVFVLRVSDERVRTLLPDYLRSEFAGSWLRTRMGGNALIPAALLQELPVPSVDHQLAAIDDQLRTVTRQLGEMSARFEAARRGAFAVASIRERLRTLNETAARARLVAELVASVDDVPATIRRAFPLPLAQGWRALEAEGDARRRYSAVLELFEATLVYLAAMMLADLREKAAPMSKVGDLLACFRTPERGPSLGQWFEVLEQSPKLSPSQALEESAFPELRLLAARPLEDPFFVAVARLRGQRNDLAHGRGPKTDRDLQEALAAAEDDLRAVFEELLFLTRYPLRHVEDADFDELEGRWTIAFRDLVGDHGIVPRHGASVRTQVGRGLYLVDQHGGLRLAGPWLRYGECPDCGHREVTAPEFGAPRARGAGAVDFKSLTNGHMHPGGPDDWLRLAKFVGVDPARFGA